MREDDIAKKIAERKRLFGFTVESVAHAANMEPRTYYRKMKNPGKFTVRELVLLERKLKTKLLDTEGGLRGV